MKPYLAKVAKLGKKIVLVDAFAGPGKFDDNSAGSPIIICQAAEQFAKDQYLAFFVNREKEFHDKLSYVLKPLVDQKKVIPILGTASDLLEQVRRILTDQTLFVYLDPFGLKGCEFATIEPFLKRPKEYSTELVINLSVPTMHRLAARKVVAAGGPVPAKVQSFHRRLSQVLGGDYWQPILWDEGKDTETKADEVMAKYREKLVSFGLPFTGSCPVREKEGKVIKYHITFCSRHTDAMLLMNDAMCTAYHERMHEADTAGTLFAGTDWKDTRDVRSLEGVIVGGVRGAPGRSRLDAWVDIVQQNFMRFLASEYKAVVAKLVKDNQLRFEDVRGTGRLNDESRLYLVEGASR
jgi:three-Cys-motif partner protein